MGSLDKARALIQSPRHKQILWIHGGTETGKTHLLQAMAQLLFSKYPTLPISYVSAKQFIRQAIEEFRGGDCINSMYGDMQFLLIDSVDFFLGCSRWEPKHRFLWLVEDILKNESECKPYLIVTADRPPSRYPSRGKDLRPNLFGKETTDAVRIGGLSHGLL